MNKTEWALDPWSDAPRWIAVPAGRAVLRIPKPIDPADTVRRLDAFAKTPRYAPIEYVQVCRHRYVLFFVGEVAAYGNPHMVTPLLCLAEVAIAFMVVIKRLVAS